MPVYRAVLACTLLVVLAPATSAQRLPTTVTPGHYDLAFDVDLGRARFAGVESIAVTLKEPSRRIVLHAANLQIQDATIVAGGVTQKAAISLNAPTETVALVTSAAVPSGAAELRIRYTGVLRDDLRGFYVSRANGRSYAVTQFESTDARRAFPSFDEPAYKATFSLAMTIDARDTAISNGRVLSDTPGPGSGRHTLRFSESPKMSSYLVAMAVGDFQCIEGAAESVPIRICATPDKREMGRVALDAAQQTLVYYNRYYSIKYPFKKLDIVAIPDFAAGAMENTASIFFREVDLLTDSRTASVGNLKRVWSVVAHEMAHMWFGDLVTMRWWDDLWLNEGFATWMEKRPLAAARPEWKMEVEAQDDTQGAMNVDSLISTRSVHSNVETPAEIEGSFDSIAYEKGAALLRMVENYVGADTFRRGVNAYLESHAYGNATSEDFWRAMTTASGQPVDRILPTFVNQPGVPVIDAALACNNGRSTLTLTTQRFLTDPSLSRLTPSAPSWDVPVCVKTPGASAPACEVVSGRQNTLAIGGGTCAAWAFVNAGAQGYFRTAYSREMLRALAPNIADHLTEPERLSLVGDEWALVRTGRHTVADYLTLADGFRNERTDGIISELSDRVITMHDYLTTDGSRPSFERFVRVLFGPLFTELGIDGLSTDDDNQRSLRSTAIATLGGAGNDPAVTAAARSAVDRVLGGGAALEPSAANAIMVVAARHGDARLWDRLLAASKAATSPSERYRYLYALASFQAPALVDRGLAIALTPDLRSQDTASYLGRFLSNPEARVRTWAFIKEHWNVLAPKITISLGDVRLVQELGTFCDATSREDIKSFFAAHKLPAASRAFDQTIERINSCIALTETQTGALTALTAWMQAR